MALKTASSYVVHKLEFQTSDVTGTVKSHSSPSALKHTKTKPSSLYGTFYYVV